MVPQEEQKHPTARKRRRIWAAFAAVAVVVLSAAVLQGSGPSADLAVAPAGATSQPATPEATSAATAPKATVAPARPKAAQPKATPDGNSSASPPQTSTKPAASAASSAIPASAIENPQLAQPVKEAVAGFITKVGQISTAPILAPAPGAPRATTPAIDFTQVAVGAALGALEAQAQEFASNGWQQSGAITVVGKATTSKLPTDGQPQLAVTVCLDSSAVTIVDNTGASVLAAAPPGTRKNLNTYIVQDVSGTWLVVNHTFPTETAC